MKKNLVIMGSHPKSLKSFDWNRKDCDIWMFNEAPNLKRDGKLLFPGATGFFQLHHEAIWKNPLNRSDQNHYAWLASGKTPTAYMQKHYEEIPKSVEYPLKEILSMTKNIKINIDGEGKDFKLFTSTPEFAFALVAYMWKQGKKYKKVEVWGIELETESEYIYQRLGFGFWIGYLSALGVNLEIHSSIFDGPIYGYEGDIAIPSSEFENRISQLSKELGDYGDTYQKEAQLLLGSLSEYLYKDITPKIQNEITELNKRTESAGILNGRITESTRYLEKAKAMEEVSGTSVFSIGEIDGNRTARSKQYTHEKTQVAKINSEINLILNKLLGFKKGTVKRQQELDLLGVRFADLLNKNMLLFLLVGAMQEDQYYIDSAKLSIKLSREQ
jgi:hypothetical protein